MDYGVSFLTRNMRYRIVQKGDEHYILDMEQSIWPIFIPFLFWVIPQRMYKVDAKIVKQLKAPTSGSNNSIAIVLIGAGGAAILTPLVKPLLNVALQSTALVNLLLLILSTTIIVSLRIYMRHSFYNRIRKTVDVQELDAVTIKVTPKYFKQYSDAILMILFASVFVVGSIYGFLKMGNLILLVSFIIFLPMLLILSSIVIHPNFGKNNLYRVTMLK